MTAPLTKLQIQELIRLFNKYSKSTVGIEYDETDTTDILADINSSYAKYTQKYLKRASLGADKQDPERKTNFVKVIYKILIEQLTPETELRDLFSYSPIALPATFITDVSFTANWMSFMDAQGYLLEYSVDPKFATSTIIDVGNVLFFNIVGLTQVTDYYYRIVAYKTVDLVVVQSDYSNRINAETLYSIPVAPTALPATDMDWEEFTANWVPMVNVTGFYIDVATDAGFVNLVVNNLQLPGALLDSYVVANMVPQDDFWYRIRAYNPAGTSPNSNPIQTATTSLAIPTILPETLVGYSSFTANWTPTNDSEGYVIQVCLTADNFSPNIPNWNDKEVIGQGVGSVLVSNPNPDQLLPLTNYSYRVRAYKYAGLTRYLSGFSGVENLTTAAAVLAPPVATAGTSITYTSFSANWNASVGATSYLIYMTRASDGAIIYNDLNIGNVLTFPVSGPGIYDTEQYTYRIKATDGVLTSIYSNPIIVPTTTYPIAVPIADPATSVTDVSFTANWHMLSYANVLNFELDVSDDNFATNLPGYDSLIVPVAQTTYPIVGLTNNTQYKYRVRARRRYLSQQSNEITVTTELNPPVEYPLLDKNGNEYTIVTINSQEWIVENYRATVLATNADINNTVDNDGYEAFVQWNNINMDIFSQSGPEIDFAQASSILGGSAGSNIMNLKEGDEIHWSIIASTTGNVNLQLYIDETPDALLVSDINGSASGVHVCTITGNYEIYLTCTSLPSTVDTANTSFMIKGLSSWIGTTLPGYCWYDNDINNKNPYGALYNDYAIYDPDFVYLERNLAEESDWRVATITDWSDLKTFLGVDSGNQMKEAGTTHWDSPNGGTNTSGLTMVGAGTRSGIDGSFSGLNITSSIASAIGENIGLAYNSSDCTLGNIPNATDGISVRLVRDITP